LLLGPDFQYYSGQGHSWSTGINYGGGESGNGQGIPINGAQDLNCNNNYNNYYCPPNLAKLFEDPEERERRIQNSI